MKQRNYGVWSTSRKHYKLPDYLVEKIIAMYVDRCMSCNAIAKSLSVNDTTVSRVLHRNGVSVDRRSGEVPVHLQYTWLMMYRSGLKPKDIGREFGYPDATIYAALHRQGISFGPGGAKRQYDLNDDFFENIDCEEKAYWLGFISADGCVHRRNLIIQLKGSDKEHIEKFRRAINCSVPISVRDVSNFGNGTVSQCRICVTSQKMVDDLSVLGVTEAKSATLVPPNLPYELMRHYWRGMIDGDGHISIDNKNRLCQAGLCGSWSTMKMFNDFLRTYTTHRVSIRPMKSIFSVTFGGVGAIKNSLSVFYGDCSVWLDRKYDRYLQVMGV